jgi:hypothetical protein
MDLSPGAFKKRNYVVKLEFVDSSEGNNELVYKIVFKPKDEDDSLDAQEDEDEDEDFIDEWENREKEEEFSDEPEIPEEIVDKKKRKSKHVQSMDDWFINHEGDDDD